MYYFCRLFFIVSYNDFVNDVIREVVMDRNNVQMSDEELLQFRMFQEQMRGIRPYDAPTPTHAELTRKELRKSTYIRRT